MTAPTRQEAPTFSIEVMEDAIRRIHERAQENGGWAAYRWNPAEGLWELLNSDGRVVAWADEKGISYINEVVWSRRECPVLARLFGWGARVFILRDRLAVVR